MTFRLFLLAFMVMTATAFSPTLGKFTRTGPAYRSTLEAKSRKKKGKAKDSALSRASIVREPRTKSAAVRESKEMNARNLLAYRLELEAKLRARIVKDVGPKPTPKTAPVLPTRDLIKEERNARNLLASRLALEAMIRSRIVKDVGPKPTPKTAPVLPTRDPIKEERKARNLLTSRLALEALIRSRIVKDVGPKPTPKTAPVLPTRDLIKEERNARNLLASRLMFEKASALAKRRREQEKRQRALLEHRLAMQSKVWEAKKAELEAIEAVRKARQQPKAPDQEQLLASKYKAIECIEERAFTILMDLGMVEA